MVSLIVAIVFAFLMYKFMDEGFLEIAFSVGFVFSVTLALGQLGMESLLLRLILSAAAWFILGMIFEELPTSSSSTGNSSASTVKKQESKSSSGLNIDNDYFLIKDGRLLEWRGESDSIIVPPGVEIIGGNDTGISKKTIHVIHIPKSVHVISDLALPHVESVYYEGPQEKLMYNKEYNFYADGWVTDWSKDSFPVRINEVNFHFNDEVCTTIIEKHFQEHPDELSPRSLEQNTTPTSSYTPSAEETVLVDETINIVNEIFDISEIAHFLSDIDYTGTVLVMPYAVRNANNTYCMKIFMQEVSELEQCRQKNIRWKDNPDNHSKNAKFYGFARKYRNNYNPSRHCYEIDTRTTVRMSKNKLPKLEAYIKEQIQKRCEMATYRGNVLYHKNFWEANN